jgi:hypothetical protein
MPQKSNQTDTAAPHASSIPQQKEDELEMADDDVEFEDEDEAEDDGELEDEDLTEERD